MPNKFSRTEIIDGEPKVTLFATGKNSLDRTLSLLDELTANNGNSAEICGPCGEAKDALRLLLRRVHLPKPRSKEEVTPETIEYTKPLPVETRRNPLELDAANS